MPHTRSAGLAHSCRPCAPGSTGSGQHCLAIDISRIRAISFSPFFQTEILYLFAFLHSPVGSTPMTWIRGLSALTTAAMPAIMPPPPAGTQTRGRRRAVQAAEGRRVTRLGAAGAGHWRRLQQAAGCPAAGRVCRVLKSCAQAASAAQRACQMCTDKRKIKDKVKNSPMGTKMKSTSSMSTWRRISSLPTIPDRCTAVEQAAYKQLMHACAGGRREGVAGLHE